MRLYRLQDEKTKFFACAKTKTQISCNCTADLIRAFVFATWIVQSVYHLNFKLLAPLCHWADQFVSGLVRMHTGFHVLWLI